MPEPALAKLIEATSNMVIARVPMSPQSKDPQDWNTYVSTFSLTTISPLEPVHHIIIAFLVDERSIALAQTSKKYYDQIIPPLYKNLSISEENFDGVFMGLIEDVANLPANTGPSVNQNECEPATIRKIGERKWKSLRSVKTLTLLDAYSADRFLKTTAKDFKSIFTEDWLHMTARKEDFGRIFVKVDHLKFSTKLISAFATQSLEPSVFSSDQMTDRTNTIKEIFFHCYPASSCFEWPREWALVEHPPISGPRLRPAEVIILQMISSSAAQSDRKDRVKLRFHVHPENLRRFLGALIHGMRDHDIMLDIDDTDPKQSMIAAMASFVLLRRSEHVLRGSQVTCLVRKARLRQTPAIIQRKVGIDVKAVSQIQLKAKEEFVCPCGHT
ncbi:uncharacterized protein I303_100105 [Kwoniella dejecticola CBS 10117]|uniref:Uncharacterized protein n=1 Tax=Kwoniella dejecticola CBS 10117 TaxID=1296121 RepID=A0A1A6AE25_9TREE|nr:uncharacterized protein I303_00105 [Kwoniella dejecticola CBS 10117]OBR88294.1 hypothetical protein I303_00105 [Kwoniella dejecticola CBS 10117]